ncbi:MAG TPA: zinc-dependent alcohol dehydrogenase family protein [Candidatus Dormibacteraeota bacterium]|jgi:threonine dehydrogenase-like Zn-dependent dehydrogenase|nr:zinc-dependent alcohol dehydrogenase family protein [Candidatus Dormibacteraeota bacterium]
MRGAVIHGPWDVRVEDRAEPEIVEPTDALIRTVATCVCGSDLWDYRGVNQVPAPKPIGHEYCGIVEEVGAEVGSISPGQFVIGSFFASDNTCPNCRAGFQASCQHRFHMTGCQAELIRVPMADGTLVATPEMPVDRLVPSLLSLSDVMSTGWFAAVCAGVEAGMTVAVVGDGAVGLCAVIAASRMGAGRVIAMSGHEPRQRLAVEFGATDIVTERGDEGVARIREMTEGVGADAVLECVGTEESMQQALRSTRAGGIVGYVGVPHGVSLPGDQLFFSHVGLRGGPAPVRRFLPDLIQLVWEDRIDPGRVFDLTLPLEQVAEGYRAMDERRAIKALLRP